MERSSVWHLVFAGIYTAVTCIFLVKLNSLNRVLMDDGYDKNAFSLISYNNFQPFKYFIFTLLLVGLGAYLFYRLFRCLVCEYEMSWWEILALILAILCSLILVILLIIFIQVPIFRAILAVGFVGTLGLYAYANR
ncbi:hypothetical protein ACSMFR_02320 [Listeria aquatica]|uniref:hypothetical protein n=1 Tax=Listeria aquatica TaxID=1494960 RepID=UPI003F713B97